MLLDVADRRELVRIFLRLGSDAESVSLWTVAGRQSIPFVCGAQQRELLATRDGKP